MKQKLCTIAAILHMLCVAVGTLVAGFVIESILGTGAAAMVVAVITLVLSLICRRYLIALACTSTILVGVAFIVGELMFFLLGGPEKAALPLCIMFLLVELITILLTLYDLRIQRSPDSPPATRFSLGILMVGTGVFASAFAIIEQFPTDLVPFVSDWSIAFNYSWLVALSLAMFLLMGVGLYSAWRAASPKSSADSKFAE